MPIASGASRTFRHPDPGERIERFGNRNASKPFRAAGAGIFNNGRKYSRVFFTIGKNARKIHNVPNVTRYLAAQVKSDLSRKMVFVDGPRQVGKTTMARSLPGAEAGYLNWDAPEHRERILKRELPPSKLWIFDELHKYRKWRNYLKGLFDVRPEGQRIMVTGSARLDVYRFGGDSLQGRYHLLRLHP